VLILFPRFGKTFNTEDTEERRETRGEIPRSARDDNASEGIKTEEGIKRGQGVEMDEHVTRNERQKRDGALLS
jgi:hypothetical protein